VPILVRDILHSTGRADAGVGDNDIHAAQSLGDLGYRLAYGGIVADITGNLEDVVLGLGEWSQVQGSHGRASHP
jgi:hypothetical protein